MKMYWGVEVWLHIFRTRWRCEVSFTPQSLYFQGKTLVPPGQEAGWAPEPVSTRLSTFSKDLLPHEISQPYNMWH